MNIFFLYLIAAGCLAIPLGIFTILKIVYLNEPEKLDKARKIFFLALAGVATFMLLMTIYHNKPAMMTRPIGKEGKLDTAMGCVNFVGVPYGNKTFLNFLAWFGNALAFPGAFLMCLCVFWPFRTGKLLTKFIELPIAILEFGFLFNLCNAMTGNCDLSYINIFIAISVGLVLALAITHSIAYRHESIKMNWKECLNMIGLFVIIFLFFLPVETLPVLNSTEGILFGKKQATLRIYDLTEMHRIVIYAAVIAMVGFYFLFRETDKNVRKVALLAVSLGCLRVFLSSFSAVDMFPIQADGSIGVAVNSLPIHLCHTAMFVVPICIAFNLKKLFYFTYFINVFGAACAIFMPNCGEFSNIYSPDVVQYWVNHFAAFGMPLLCVALKVFDRPKFKQMCWSLGFFAVYFVIIMFLNAWFSNYVEGGTDYLFINNDFILSKMFNETQTANILNQTFSWKWGDLTFTIRPLYQGCFFLVYAVVAFGMWFVYSLFFRIADSHYELHCLLKVAKKENIDMRIRKAKEEKNENVNHDIKLIFDNFSKRYGNSAVLSADKICLEVKGGEIFGFLGPNGAGKSTCIKSAIGIQPVTDGHINVCGYDVTTQPVQTKKLIGYVPDHYALYEKLTGREYINYIADLYGVSQEDRDERISRYVDLFELTQAFDNRMQTYSHGMKQKITIMAALVHNPKIWILDEPLTGLDPQSIFQVKQCMIRHAEEGNIVFFSSHIIDVVEKLCTRIAIVKKGHIVYEADMKTVEKEHPEGLESFYLSTIRDNGDLDI